MDIVLLGLNHKTAAVDLRECLAFGRGEIEMALERLRALPPVRETLLISTCNRVEILTVGETREALIAAVKRFLADAKQVPLERFEPAFYLHSGDEAVRHLFRVAASLDSMMVGEPQILGQVKEAYRAATETKSSGVILNRLMHRAFFVAKRVRSETGIGDRAVSISYAAIELSRKIFGSLQDKQVLLVGAGEMAELAVEHLIRHQAGTIFVANRTFATGLALAERFHGQALRFEEIPRMLERVDIIIGSTGAPGFILTRDQVKCAMRSRKNRPLFFIDIAVPRDIDPQINRLTNAYVYDIDDLQQVVDENVEDRQRAAVQGERLVDEAVIHFRQWLDSLAVVPTIVALRAKLEGITRAELERTCSALPHLGPDDQQALARMMAATVNKILHDPTLLLKSESCQGADRSVLIDSTRKLFKLDGN
jgi:glutamyl-tRNA reductase